MVFFGFHTWVCGLQCQCVSDDRQVCGGDGSVCTDCAGVTYGSAYKDPCDTCDANRANDCTQDCRGVWGGASAIDDCGVCGGDGRLCVDCAGMAFGVAAVDKCGACDEVAQNDCRVDCVGAWGGGAKVDSCGVCNGATIQFHQILIILYDYLSVTMTHIAITVLLLYLRCMVAEVVYCFHQHVRLF